MTIPPKPRVLCIDDDPGILYTLEAIGEQAGWEVVTARTGRSGLNRVVESDIDLAIVDYHMPDMDGLATVRRIRKRSQRLPILVLTVDERQELADEFLEAGANDFALKPIKAPDLIARVNVHLKYARQVAGLEPGKASPGRGQGDEEGRTESQAYRLARTLPDISGVNRATLLSVLEVLGRMEKPLTASDVAREVGCAYPTACRYLSFLESEGVLDIEIDYGDVGRPTKRYTLPKE